MKGHTDRELTVNTFNIFPVALIDVHLYTKAIRLQIVN